MVITAQEKTVLLERLEKARQVKQAKAEAARAAKASPVAAPISAPAPEHAIEEVKQLPPLEPLVAQNAAQVADDITLPPKVKNHEKLQKREINRNSSDESDNEKPIKKSSKKKAKQTPYMKIKIFHEPKNHAALQNLIEAVQDNNDEYDDTELEAVAPAPPIIKGARNLQRVGSAPRKNTPSSLTMEDVKNAELRRLAIEMFG
jgi:hypothetical protein